MPDTRNARRRILDRIRAVQKRPVAWLPGEQALAAELLRNRSAGPQPRLDGDRTERFCSQAQLMGSTLEKLRGDGGIPAAVAGYLTANALPLSAVAWPELASLDWAGTGIEISFRIPDAETKVGVSGVFCGIAETGTLVLLSGPDHPLTIGLIPEAHIAVVSESRIVATMEDAFALIRKECGDLPHAVNMISGPSRTGDIEQTIVMGAHGPCRVHIIVVAA